MSTRQYLKLVGLMQELYELGTPYYYLMGRSEMLAVDLFSVDINYVFQLKHAAMKSGFITYSSDEVKMDILTDKGEKFLNGNTES